MLAKAFFESVRNCRKPPDVAEENRDVFEMRIKIDFFGDYGLRNALVREARDHVQNFALVFCASFQDTDFVFSLEFELIKKLCVEISFVDFVHDFGECLQRLAQGFCEKVNYQDCKCHDRKHDTDISVSDSLYTFKNYRSFYNSYYAAASDSEFMKSTDIFIAIFIFVWKLAIVART